MCACVYVCVFVVCVCACVYMCVCVHVCVSGCGDEDKVQSGMYLEPPSAPKGSEVLQGNVCITNCL